MSNVIMTAVGKNRQTKIDVELELIEDCGDYHITRSDMEENIYIDEEFIEYFLTEGGDEDEVFNEEEDRIKMAFTNYSLGDFSL